VWEQDGFRPMEGDLYGQWRAGDRLAGREEVGRLAAPAAPPNIICIGRNYRSHADEFQRKTTEEPVVFSKLTTSLIGPGDPIVLPANAPNEVDWEGEVGLVIKKTARRVPEAEALDCVLGYTAVNDLSARDCQLRRDVQWTRGKSFDTFCSVGPCIQTEGDPDNLRLTLRVNGETMQDARTTDLIFHCRRLVSYLSHQFTLLPGTLIATGSPGGCGFTREPPIFLAPGDQVEVEVEGVGILSNPVVADRSGQQ
jgi:2-keto-4-pentenoate hydratase/2-oxohepta-3-ene-1,7-dioic acid hydratase in catechol pathway